MAVHNADVSALFNRMADLLERSAPTDPVDDAAPLPATAGAARLTREDLP